jgi:pre-mRNA-splicing factor ISY1
MARNAEKANLMLNKWTALKSASTAASLGLDGKGGGRGGDREKRRPYLASECKVLPEAERWRLDIIHDVARRMSDVQNAGLGEARLRDLNDEINKLLREKGHWERQIKALGGPDYAVTAPRLFDAEGREVAGGGGYRYFGAAKDLPGVRELIVVDSADSRKRPRQEDRRTRADISKGLTPEYYGSFGGDDGDGGQLAAKEAEREAQLIRQAVQEWAVRKRRVVEQVKRTGAAVGKEELDLMEATDDVEKAVSAALLSSPSSSSSAAPSEEELVAQKKADFLAKLGL